ncbi:hypothetical protein [Nesterenkonia alkaliphila]|uniref:Uncharacterized protein n=1 Tax=Nesterenkonia alkaliphila TaxID=1463631 RepID=A0A7K1ULS2_9MICC|nr:hypothetical protein [Nesterenkonia alkaliphila]MVT26981.1 hypothetical protein [Nesterenkonia alkaliphila]GFZ90175.1 hypothetical protein GCM10011359_19460 [Nesterenkonia alkaliphila]
MDFEEDFERVVRSVFDGALTDHILDGGAYRSFPGTFFEAKELGTRLAYELFKGRPSDMWIYTCPLAWSEWFCGIVWDRTFVVIDTLEGTISLHCSTTSD